MSAIITIEDLAVNYGDFRALHNITLTINRSDFFAVIGPNGSGKSTLIKAIVGLVNAVEGKINIEKTEKIGYLPQKTETLDPRFPANVEEIALSGFRGRNKKYAKKRLEAVLDLLRITDIRDRKIGQISGGQQQRAILARALINEPSILVLDEPTGALDPSSRECFYNTISDMNKKGVTIIMVSHDSRDIEKYAQKIAFIDRTLKFCGNFADFNIDAHKHYFNHNHSH
jgi:zinc transport system ATP-binding protein